MGVEPKAIIVGSDVEITRKPALSVEMYIKSLVFKWETYLHKLIEAKHTPAEGSLKSYLSLNNQFIKFYDPKIR